MKMTLRSVSIVLLVVASSLTSMMMSVEGLFNKNHVVIRNALQHNKRLMVHCKSKDDDLKYHLVPPYGTYSFGFRDNLFVTTLFSCNLRQGPNFKHHQEFVAYEALRIQYGRTVIWEAREDGIYLFVNNTHFVFVYRWDVPHEATSPLSSVDESLSSNPI